MAPILQPEYYETAPDELERIIRSMESWLIIDIVRRIKEAALSTETTDYQYERLLAIRRFNTDYKAKIAEMTSKGLKEIDLIFDKAATNSAGFHKQDYIRKGIPFVEYKDNAVLQQFTRAAAGQTRQTFRNLTRTVGFVTRKGGFLQPREMFIRKLSEASTQVALGATTYDEAIKRTVKELSASGLKAVEYPHARPWSLAASVRANVLTSIGALSGEIEVLNMKELGFTHVETTAHTTARESHQPWQGRTFALNMDADGMKRKYEEIREVDAGVRAMRRAEGSG